MTALPGIVVEAQRDRVWTAAVTGVCLAAAAAVVAWMSSRNDAPSGSEIALTALALLLLLGAATVLRRPTGRLRWDGQQWWHLPAEGTAVPGALDVAVDLGKWMLLRFRPDEARLGPVASAWWPVRWGTDPHAWHALRCAVYSPRPAGGAAAADLPSLPE